MKRLPLIAGSAVLGLGAGFGLSALRSASPDAARGTAPAAPGSDSAASLSPAPASTPARRRPGGSALVEKLRTELALTQGVTRWLVWMTAVEKAGPEDYPALARMAKNLPGALNMLAARWIATDPAGLFEMCRHPGPDGLSADGGEAAFPAGELGHMLMETWPKEDPEAVLAALRNSPGLQSGLQFSALNTLMGTHPEQTLILMSALGVDSYGPSMKGVEKWAAADPRHAAETALKYPAGSASRMVLEEIGKVWADRDPAAALAFAAAQDSSAGAGLADEVMRRWVEKDAAKASDWLAAADGPERARLLPSFVEAWGKTDTSNALQWCLANTAGSQQADVINRLVKGAASRNVDSAAALVSGLESGPLQARAAVAFVDAIRNQHDSPWWPGISSSTRTARPEAIAWLGQLQPESRAQVLKSLSWSWGQYDPRGFADYLSTPEGLAAAGPEALLAAGRGLVRGQPAQAVEWASQVPESDRAMVLSETFQTWLRAQPDTAMDWLGKLPLTDSRREAFYSGVLETAVPSRAFHPEPLTSLEPVLKARQDLARLLATNPAAAREAIGRLALTPAERSRAFASLKLEP